MLRDEILRLRLRMTRKKTANFSLAAFLLVDPKRIEASLRSLASQAYRILCRLRLCHRQTAATSTKEFAPLFKFCVNKKKTANFSLAVFLLVDPKRIEASLRSLASQAYRILCRLRLCHRQTAATSTKEFAPLFKFCVNKKKTANFSLAVFLLVDPKRIELSTLRMRTVRSPS